MNGHQKLGRIAPAIACLLLGCAPGIPTEALQINPQTLAQREASSRSYDTGNEGEILSASVQVLQDLGFTIDRTAADAGLVTASKQRDATEGGQVAAAVAMAVLFGVYMPVDDNQLIRASIVTRPIEESKKTYVRVAFQRIVTNTQGQTSKIESLNDPELYASFFRNLEQAIYLEGEKV
jgi:hypothetical protein